MTDLLCHRFKLIRTMPLSMALRPRHGRRDNACGCFFHIDNDRQQDIMVTSLQGALPA
jgi:hypothetical protein